MIVDLVELEGASRSYQFEIAAADIDLDDPAIRLTSDLQVECEVVRHAAQVDIRGTIGVEAEIECTRCLEPVSHTLPIEFTASFVAPENFSATKEHEVAAEDLDTDVLESDRLDLKEIVREQILLNLPEQVFCGPDCKGICPKCGANRNLIDCNCDLTETDPRWEALRNLKQSE